MAIIYSYPLNLNILDTDIIIGTTTRLVNGRPKNQTKSFKIEDLANYFIPTLNQVLQVGNVSQLDAKIGELYLYDDSVGGYAKMGVSDNVFMLDSAGGVNMLTIDNGTNLVLNNGIAAAQIINPLTTNRTYTLPDKSGTIALTSDITIPTLQQVTDFGDTTSNDISANSLSIYDGPNGEYCKIAINDGYFTINRPQGAFTPMLSTENGDNLILTNSNGAAAQIINNLLISRNYTLPNASGTLALTSDLTVPTLQIVTDFGDTTSNDITANSFIKSSGTSDQILLADGSTSSLAAKANLASPTFTGTPTLPTGTIATTQTALDNSTKLATTAFVTTADDLKADKSMSAYSVRVNNTASTANETEVTYRAPGQQVYTGTITWTGTTAPSGATNFSYNWNQINNLVTLKITLNYATVGSALTAVLMTLPSDCPNPLKPTGYTAGNNNLYTGIGIISVSVSAIPATAARVVLKSNSANNGFEISANATSAGYSNVDITIQYFTS